VLALSSLLQEPTLVESIVAAPPGDWLLVSVLNLPDVEAKATVVSDVSSASSEPGDLLEVSLSVDVRSDDSKLADSESLLELVGDGVVSHGSGSDGSSSLIKSPDVVLDTILEGGDSESVVLGDSSDLSGVVVKNSVSWEDGSDDEGGAVSDWVSWCVEALSADIPDLVLTVMAVVPLEWSLVGESSSVNVEALSSLVPEVLSLASEEAELLIVLVSPSSDDGWSSNLVSLAVLVGDSEVSVLGDSDRVSSGVVDEPVPLVPGWGFVDSESVSLSSGSRLEVVVDMHIVLSDLDVEEVSVLDWEEWELGLLGV